MVCGLVVWGLYCTILTWSSQVFAVLTLLYDRDTMNHREGATWVTTITTE